MRASRFIERMLASQFADLEEPSSAIMVDVLSPQELMVQQILAALRKRIDAARNVTMRDGEVVAAEAFSNTPVILRLGSYGFSVLIDQARNVSAEFLAIKIYLPIVMK